MADNSIGSLLARPHIPESTSSALPPDPVVPMRIQTTIDNVVAYTDNPRQTKNPLFDEIKESIRNRGLDHAPNVTRKSPSDPYMIKDGGNTRLQALRELWEETGDQKFYHLDLMFHPWKNQLDMLIGHAVENEMRGNMIFIERAFHAKKIKHEIESEENTTLSVRELAKRITAEGWSLNQASLTQMMYAEETLFPVIPEAFWSGIGIDRVKKIRKLLESCRTYWDAVSDNEGSFDDIWVPVFAKLDGDGFDVTNAEYQLCGAMAQRMDGPILSVTAQVQGIIEGVKNMELVRPNRFNPVANDQQSSQPSKAPKEKTTPITNKTAPVTKERNAHDGATPTLPVDDISGVAGSANAAAPIDFSLSDNPVNPLFSERKYSLTELPGGTPILYSGYCTHTTQYLQERALEVATSYARRFGLQQNILSTLGEPEKHIGFWVSSDGFDAIASNSVSIGYCSVTTRLSVTTIEPPSYWKTWLALLVVKLT
jgi:ParB family protein of integrating conjugative element (PFGI_1 class)